MKERVSYREFCEQYHDWWFASENKCNELRDRVLNRAKLVLGIED